MGPQVVPEVFNGVRIGGTTCVRHGVLTPLWLSQDKAYAALASQVRGFTSERLRLAGKYGRRPNLG
jgi:hypothetical protein